MLRDEHFDIFANKVLVVLRTFYMSFRNSEERWGLKKGVPLRRDLTKVLEGCSSA